MSTPMNPPAPPTPPPSSPSPPAPPVTPGSRSRKTLYVVVAVVVIVVVLLVAFIVLPSLTSSGGPSGPLTYSGAKPIADGAMSGYQGGGWTLLFAAGLVTPTSETFPVNTSALGNLSSSGCTYHIVTGAATYTVPAFTGNRSAGETPAWEFGYRNASDTLAFASVLNGTATVLATITGTECAFFAQLLTPIPGNVIDSSQAAADVAPDAGAFLAAHPNASGEFALLGGINFLGHTVPAEWSIIYTTCTLTPNPTGTGEMFNATVNALTGAVSGAQTNNSAVCGNTTVTAASPDRGASPSAPTAADCAVAARSAETV